MARRSRGIEVPGFLGCRRNGYGLSQDDVRSRGKSGKGEKSIRYRNFCSMELENREKNRAVLSLRIVKIDYRGRISVSSHERINYGNSVSRFK